MKLSIITINYNNLEGLRRTVASVAAQTCMNFEYIVIDGGSTDGSREYIKTAPRIDSWVSEPDKGIYNAMNKGAKMAQGEYCLFLNSGDTLYDKNVLCKVIPVLNGGDFYAGHPILVKGRKSYKEYLPQKMSIDFLLLGSINHQSTFTRTAILKKRPYNENHKIVSDWEKFFTEWLLYDRSYIPMDLTIAKFRLDGISSNDISLLLKEKQEVIDNLIPSYIQKGLRMEKDLSPLELKIKKALSKPPLQRDVKLIRNALKYLLQDLFLTIVGRKKD